MKQLTTQKWILSSLLIAALGSQYYFSTSSKNIETIDLASTGVEAAVVTLSKVVEATKKPVVVTVVDNKPDTEAAASAVCADCVILTKLEADKIRQILLEVAKPHLATTEKEAICADEKTALDRKKCEIAEAKDKREAALLAKKEKLDLKKLEDEQKKEIAQLEIDTSFEEKYLDLISNCKDVACYSSKMTSVLRRYTGKKRVTPDLVTRLFKEHIAADLKAGLSDPSNETALKALETLTSELPAEYAAIKKSSIGLANNAETIIANKAILKHKEAQTLAKQAQSLVGNANKLNEWSQMNNSAFQAAGEALEAKNEYKQAFINHKIATQVIEDQDYITSSTDFDFANIHYAKFESAWLQKITGQADAGAGSPVNPNQASQSNDRSGRNGNNNQAIDNKISLPNMNQNTNSGSDQFGNQQQGSRSGRSSY